MNSTNLKAKTKYQLYSLDVMKDTTLDTNQNQDRRSCSPKRSQGLSDLLKKSKVLCKLPLMNNSSINNPYINNDIVNKNNKNKK